jgi:hypothetical protein
MVQIEASRIAAFKCSVSSSGNDVDFASGGTQERATAPNQRASESKKPQIRTNGQAMFFSRRADQPSNLVSPELFVLKMIRIGARPTLHTRIGGDFVSAAILR